jgi:histidinol-phosphatase (PHP family)
MHSYISTDSSLDPELIIEKAIKRAYNKIAFTDHYEPMFPNWSFHTSYSIEKYLAIYNELKEKYKDQIEILTGIEIGEYQDYKSETDDFLAGTAFDIKIGSVHSLPPNIDISTPMKRALTKKEISKYYLLNLKMVENCDINVLGHLGIFCRYLKHDISHVKPILKDIFQTMIERNIALEINYSGLRKSTKQIMPHIPVLEQYASEGGNLLSIGSDSHHLSDFDSNYDDVLAILSNIGMEYRIITCQQ